MNRSSEEGGIIVQAQRRDSSVIDLPVRWSHLPSIPRGLAVITLDDVRRFSNAFPEVEEFTHFRFGQPVF